MPYFRAFQAPLVTVNHLSLIHISNVTIPFVGLSTVVKTLIKVVFPAPFSPNSPNIPFGISKSCLLYTSLLCNGIEELLKVFSVHLHWLREIIPVCLVFVLSLIHILDSKGMMDRSIIIEYDCFCHHLFSCLLELLHQIDHLNRR